MNSALESRKYSSSGNKMSKFMEARRVEEIGMMSNLAGVCVYVYVCVGRGWELDWKKPGKLGWIGPYRDLKNHAKVSVLSFMSHEVLSSSVVSNNTFGNRIWKR